MKPFRMMLLIFVMFVVVVFLTVEVAQCQSKEIHFFGGKVLVKDNPDWDGWIGPRIISGGVCYGFGRWIGLSEGNSVLLVALMAYLWEWYFDGLQNKLPFDIYSCDPGGADFQGDPAWPVIGAGLTLICDKLNKLTKSKVFAVDRRGLTMSINL